MKMLAPSEELQVNKLAHVIVLAQSEAGRATLLYRLKAKKVSRVNEIIDTIIEQKAREIISLTQKKANEELKTMSPWMRNKVKAKLEKLRKVNNKQGELKHASNA